MVGDGRQRQVACEDKPEKKSRCNPLHQSGSGQQPQIMREASSSTLARYSKQHENITFPSLTRPDRLASVLIVVDLMLGLLQIVPFARNNS